MTKPATKGTTEQIDLFLPYLSDLPLRDQREMMERPFFSLAKSKRVKPIDYRSPDGKLWVHVSASSDYGMATIWDADILIYCASMLADMARRGINDVPRTLHLMPYDLLRAIGRQPTGRAYELLGQALDRLVATTVKTNIRADAGLPAGGRGRREATFSWLDGWTQMVDEKTERSRGMTIQLSAWFWEGVMMTGGVLSIDRAYFDITGGRERWLYKVARKHAGGAGEAGFAIALPTLFEKSGAEGQYRRFKFEIARIVERDELPGYRLALETVEGQREPMLRMRRRPGGEGAAVPAAAAPSPAAVAVAAAPDAPVAVDVGALVRRSVTSLSTRAQAGDLTDATLATLRAECPGWDYQTLHAEFRTWVEGDPARTPVSYQNAFIGYVRRYHARNRHLLRG
ncbi:plasmid replication initiation protein [Sphingomonas sp. SORGH_AS802]|uniref:replication initiator protein A n=1 Tax=unclassified Sphingomonas TaxID=196159 RepID=UPI002854276A|nr:MULTISPECIES: replication initiator protein A [unclassified Sphingomonas]MDR6129012.1 plasmid replication initiation protein [Sphingomonas sp. SORGH_AS_0438]MDR6136430.1 plasmid replication initiation protein [Sphingomonas sp. SORGH_AS_0802]